MQFNVAQLLKLPVGTVRDFDIDETAPANPDIHWTAPLHGHVQFMRTGPGVLVRAHLKSTAAGICGRCLIDVQVPVHIDFEEEFLSTVDLVTGLTKNVRAEQSEGTFLIDEKHMLDLTEAIRQYALLDLPLQVVCNDACTGLCPTCGANRNLGPCACPQVQIDSRWAKLSELHVDVPASQKH